MAECRRAGRSCSAAPSWLGLSPLSPGNLPVHPCEVGWFESRRAPRAGVESHCRLPGPGGIRDFSGVWSLAPHWLQSLGPRRAEGAASLVSTFSELSGCVIPVASPAGAPGRGLSCVPPPGLIRPATRRPISPQTVARMWIALVRLPTRNSRTVAVGINHDTGDICQEWAGPT